MSEGDLVQTIIEKQPVVLIKKLASKVWYVLKPDGSTTSEWVLNLEPYAEQV